MALAAGVANNDLPDVPRINAPELLHSFDNILAGKQAVWSDTVLVMSLCVALLHATCSWKVGSSIRWSGLGVVWCAPWPCKQPAAAWIAIATSLCLGHQRRDVPPLSPAYELFSACDMGIDTQSVHLPHFRDPPESLPLHSQIMMTSHWRHGLLA